MVKHLIFGFLYVGALALAAYPAAAGSHYIYHYGNVGWNWGIAFFIGPFALFFASVSIVYVAWITRKSWRLGVSFALGPVAIGALLFVWFLALVAMSS